MKNAVQWKGNNQEEIKRFCPDIYFTSEFAIRQHTGSIEHIECYIRRGDADHLDTGDFVNLMYWIVKKGDKFIIPQGKHV